GESAAKFLARATVREMTEVIRDYGEERFAQSIARAVAAARTHEPVERTRQLAQIVGEAVGARTRGDWNQDPATRTFQAIRIFVNRALSAVALALPRSLSSLAPRPRCCRCRERAARRPRPPARRAAHRGPAARRLAAAVGRGGCMRPRGRP